MSTVFAGSNGLRKVEVDFEARWVMAAKAGYALAFEELVTRNERRIYRLALNITQNQQDAEDLLQDTFVEAQELLQEYRSASNFSTWLVQICIRGALLKFRERELNLASLDETAESNDDLVPSELGTWGDCPDKTLREKRAKSNPFGSNLQARPSTPDRVSSARCRELLDGGYRGFARTLRFGNKVAPTPSTPRCP